MKKYLLLNLLLILSYNSKCQNDTNIISKDGKKNGLWLENSKTELIEAYYQKNLLNGFYRSYSKKNNLKLSSFGFFLNGKMAGNWYFFDDKSLIYLSCEGIKINKNIIILNDDKSKIVPKNYGYIKLFHKNGNVKEEGFAVFEDIEENFYKVGQWKYFNDLGNILKIENYKSPKIAD